MSSVETNSPLGTGESLSVMATKLVAAPTSLDTDPADASAQRSSSRRRHVLFMVSDFAPMPSVGRLRTQRFCRHLPDCGWRVSVLTFRPSPSVAIDSALEAEIPTSTRVSRVACPQPFEWPVRIASRLARAVMGAPPVERPTTGDALEADQIRTGPARWASSPSDGHGTKRWVARIAGAVDSIKRWLTRHLLIPDEGIAGLPGMVRHAVATVRHQQVDVIVASVPGFAPWLAAVVAGRITKRPVIVDYRDLWSGDVLRIWVGRWRSGFELIMERWALSASSAVVTVSEQKTAYVRTVDRRPDRRSFRTIYNSFDATELPADATPSRDPRDGDRFVWLYAGRLYGHRRIDPLLEAMGRLVRAGKIPNDLIRLRILGSIEPVHAERLHRLADEYGFQDVLRFDGYVTRRVSLERLLGADVATIVVDPGPNCDGVLPGKITECIGLGSYIFGLCHPGEASALLDTYGHAAHAPPNEPQLLDSVVLRLVDRFLTDRTSFQLRCRPGVVPTAAEAAGTLSRLLNEVVDRGVAHIELQAGTYEPRTLVRAD